MLIFLRKHVPNEDVKKCKLCEYLPTQKKKENIHKDKKSRLKKSIDDLWTFPISNPKIEERKLMFGLIMSTGVRLVMNNHVYKFNKITRVQENKGGIGVELTGVLAELKMLLWGWKLQNKLKNLNIINDVYDRFVDDITMLPSVIKPGFKLVGDKLVYNEEKFKEDTAKPGDSRTMDIIKQVADKIDPNIQVTFDVPSFHKDGFVPILDLKVRYNPTLRKIEHIFYKKDIANKLLTMKNSAMSVNSKINILTQQCFKRFHNTSESIPDKLKVEILEDFMLEMYLSGYSENERFKILMAGWKTYQNLKDKENKGLRPFYRKNSFRKKERFQEKISKKNNWFKQSNDQKYSSVIFVEATPGDKLLKSLKHIEEENKISDKDRIKFVSRSGTKLINLLQKKDPFNSQCDKIDCKPCEDKSKNEPSHCKTQNVTYSAQCKVCEKDGKTRIYYGETCRNLHVRSKEHYKDFTNNSKHSWMLKHIQSEHRNIKSNECDFKWQVMSKFRKPMQRQISEAINIENSNASELLNLKMSTLEIT